MSAEIMNFGVIRRKRHEIISDRIKEQDDKKRTPGKIYADRYIPRRCTASKYRHNTKHLPVPEIPDLLALCDKPNYWKEVLYHSRISNALSMKPGRVLKLTEPELRWYPPTYAPVHHQIKDASILNRDSLLDWACIPRCKPSAYIAHSFSLNVADCESCDIMMAWSTIGQVAFVVGPHLIIYDQEFNIESTFEIDVATSIRFSPCGKFLALGRKIYNCPFVDVWSVYTDEYYILAGMQLSNVQYSVHCIAWTQDCQHLACGLSNGTIYIIEMPDLKIKYNMEKFAYPVVAVLFSPNMGHLASSDGFGNIIVFDWPSCQVKLYVGSSTVTLVSFDWHPWRHNELVIAKMRPASILLLNVESKKIIARYHQSSTNMYIQKVIFNKLSGELLVEICTKDVIREYKILVLGALDRVVDRLDRTPIGDVRFLCWSPDGTHLASAGKNDIITIWKFYFHEANNHERSSAMDALQQKTSYSIRKRYAHPLERTYGRTFRKLAHIR